MADNPFLTSANPMQLMQQAQQLPPELQPEMRDITRQQQLANMLTQQAFNQPQGQMVSGRYVAPSFFQNIAPMVNAYLGQRGAEQADIKQAALAEKLREGGAKENEEFNRLMGQGTPEEQKAAFQYAQNAKYSPILRGLSSEMAKPYTLGEGQKRIINIAGQELNLGKGGEKLANEVRSATQVIGLPDDPSKWTPQDRAAIDAKINQRIQAGKTVFNPVINTGKSLIDQIGPMVKDSKVQAMGAYKNIDSADKIINALNSGNLIAGSMANERLAGARLIDTLGFGGSDNAAKLANTRDAIQGLAGLVLAGRQQMRGEGAISNSESQVAEKAASGDINLSPYELMTLANAAKRSGAYQIQSHQDLLNEMSQHPETKVAVPYYKVSPLPPAASQNKDTPPPGVTQAQWNVMSESEKAVMRGGK